MGKNKILDSIFSQFLTDKQATVSAAGLFIEGISLGEVTLRYEEDHGLICLGDLKDNSVSTLNELETVFTAKRESMKLSFDSLENITRLMSEVLDKLRVQYGTVSTNNVRNFETTTDDSGEISTLIIIYKDGSRVCINNIQ